MRGSQIGAKKIKIKNKSVTLEKAGHSMFTIMVLNSRPEHHCLNPIRYPSVVDPDSLSLDPDPACQVNTDPDPACQVNTDPDPGF